MNQNVCISKKNTYIGLFVLFVLIFIGLSRLALQSNHADNSKAAETNESAVLVPSLVPTLTTLQQDSALIFKASRNNTGNIELFGQLPVITDTSTSSLYSVYMRKPNGSLTLIDTFIASQEKVKERLTTFWKPKTGVSQKDVETNDFLLYEQK